MITYSDLIAASVPMWEQIFRKTLNVGTFIRQLSLYLTYVYFNGIFYTCFVDLRHFLSKVKIGDDVNYRDSSFTQADSYVPIDIPDSMTSYLRIFVCMYTTLSRSYSGHNRQASASTAFHLYPFICRNPHLWGKAEM